MGKCVNALLVFSLLLLSIIPVMAPAPVETESADDISGLSDAQITALDSLREGMLSPSRSNHSSYITPKAWYAANYASTIGPDEMNSVAVDNAGNAFVTGLLRPGNDQNILGNLPITLVVFDYLPYVAKLSRDGTWLWYAAPTATGTAGSQGYPAGYGVVADANGDAYITGTVEARPLTFGNTTELSQCSMNHNCGFVAKISSNGDWLWATKIPSRDEPVAIAITPTGDLVVTGLCKGAMTVGPESASCTGSSDVFIAKFHGINGTGAWIIQSGLASTGNRPTDIGVDANGHIYLSGAFAGSISFSSNSGTCSASSAGTSTDAAFVAKFDSSGACIWIQQGTSMESDDSWGEGIAVTPSGEVFFTGHFHDSITFGWSGNTTFTSLGGYDGFIAKLSTNGTWEWIIQISSQTHIEARDIAVDSSGVSYAVGNFQASVTATGQNPNSALSSLGNKDVYVYAISDTGTYAWSRSFGSGGQDYAQSVDVDSDGFLFVSGTFSQTANVGDHIVPHLANADGIVAILAPDYDDDGIPARTEGCS